MLRRSAGQDMQLLCFSVARCLDDIFRENGGDRMRWLEEFRLRSWGSARGKGFFFSQGLRLKPCYFWLSEHSKQNAPQGPCLQELRGGSAAESCKIGLCRRNPCGFDIKLVNILLMIYNLHHLKEPELWELWV